MRCNLLTRFSMAGAALGLALGLGAPSESLAAPLPFTWDPSATGNSTVGAFTADHFGLNDFAAITVPANPAPIGSVTETGFLLPTTFFLGGTQTAFANIKGGWGIYEAFTATSHLTPCTGGLCGVFDTITANVYVYSTAKGVASVNFPGTVPTIHLPALAHSVLIGTESGPISGSPNLVNIVSGVPSASVDVLFTQNPAESEFFVKPAATMILDLDQAFINTPGVITTVPSTCKNTGALPCKFEIHSGGGNGNFLLVPEPATLGIFGFGLTLLGIARRRRV